MKSFLETIDDNHLVWDEQDDEESSSASSDSSSSSSSSEDDAENNNDNDGGRAQHEDPDDAPGFVFIDHEDAQQQQEGEEEDPAAAAAAASPNRELPTQDRTDTATFSRIMDSLRNHPRHDQLLLRISRSEELPLVRADIDWDLLKSQLSSYPAEEVGDARGSILLQGILRMNPPVSIVQEAISVFPKAFVDMDSFFVAIQYANTSESCEDVVKLVVRHTMEARHAENIAWGMLALLGDARIRIRHAQILLDSMPGSVTDPSHGVFGVSPLDRMLSGAFIHGDCDVWVEKLKLALMVAEFGPRGGSSGGGGKQPQFFPFHALIRRLISSDFMGVQFGAFTFLRTLLTCMKSNKCRFKDKDESQRIPLHVALETNCNTNLGVAGERKLIKFLLQAWPESASIPHGTNHALPLRMAVANGWPVYDIISDELAARAAVTTTTSLDMMNNHPIHVVLGGTYHRSFGVAGAREIVKYLLRKFPSSAKLPNGQGRLPLHIALENCWPCHDILISAQPQALETRDVATHFYPFQIMACASSSHLDEEENEEQQANKEENLREMSVLFELIKENPMLARGLARHDGKVVDSPSEVLSKKRKREKTAP